MRPETVLAFDTSAAHCAAALLLPGGQCLHRHAEMAKGQAEALMPMLEDLLHSAGLGWRELTALGVGTGPGDFTGVRISVAAARGLSLALGIPAIGVTIFDALAEGLPRPLAVVQDARRDGVYLQILGPSPAPATETTGASLEATLIPRDPAVERLRGLPRIGTAAADFGTEDVLTPAMPLAEAIARLARARAGIPQPRPAPFYLRGADAAPPSEAPPVILDA